MLKIAFNPVFSYPLPAGHRFPMEKYELLPKQLLFEGTIQEENLFQPEPAEDTAILLTHSLEYLERLKMLSLTEKEMRRIGFPLSRQLIEREILIAGGTVACTDFAFQYGIAMNIAGGTHHAFRDRGEGYCILNDQAIAANYLLYTKSASRILIIDLDVHQGNGTASIFESVPEVFTFSMHGNGNYPYQKEHSDLDLNLKDGIDDEAYLTLLKDTLPGLFDRHKPDFVFYLSGVDVLASDKLGKLSLTREGCKERDRIVLQECNLRNLPVVVCMGGGYSERIADIIEAHANTFRLAQEIYF